MLTIDVEAEFDPILLKEALEALQQAVELEPGKTRYRQAYAEALLAARRNEDALDQLTLLHRKSPSERTTYLVALASFRTGDHDGARALLDSVEDEGTVGFAKFHILRGHLEMAKSRYSHAANEYGEAMIMNPRSATARWHRSRALIAVASRRAEAGALYRRALHILREFEPNSGQESEYHYLLGRTYLALLYPVEALRHLEQSRFAAGLEKDLLVGIALLLSGRPKRARGSLARAAQNREMRDRVEAFLTEIASAPEATIRGMTQADSATNARQHAMDLDLLVSVFGPGAPEIDRITAAAQSGRLPELAKTQVENMTPFLGGRLFAEIEPQDDAATVRADAYSEAKTDGASISSTTSVTADGEVSTQKSAIAADQLFPQTHVDVTEALSLSELNSSPAAGQPDIPGTAKLPTLGGDYDEVPDLDFGELDLNDDDTER